MKPCIMSETLQTIPYIITYSDPSQSNVLFLAGTFSEPEWMLQKMNPCGSCAEPSTYSICVNVQPGKEYQYRFRRGRKGEWAVDDDKPVVKSALGTKSNILRVSCHDSYASDAVDLPVPLLAHERLGTFTLTGSSQTTRGSTGELVLLLKETKREKQISPRSYHYGPADLDHVTLESFPCDNSSILDTLCKIQSTLADELAVIDHDRARRYSVDSDEASSGSGSPSMHRRREGRLLSVSNGRTQSVASLGSIAEEPCSNSRRQDLKNISETLLADDGEALVMRSSKRH